MNATTYNVRVYKTKVYKGKKVTTYYVRWKVGGHEWKEPHRTSAQADSFRSSLLAAARNGEAFSLAIGRPVSWQRDESSMSWYALALHYAAAKWPYAAPNHRRSIAEALTDATEVMLIEGEHPHPRNEVRRALRTWVFSGRLRSGQSKPPDDLGYVIRWLETATIPVTDLVRPGTGAVRTRALLDRISKKKDGSIAAANTANRKRAVLNNVTNAEPRSGSAWTDAGTVRQRGTLKHRAPGDTRPVPIHPELVTFLRSHLKRYGTGRDDRMFTLPRGGVLTDREV